MTDDGGYQGRVVVDGEQILHACLIVLTVTCVGRVPTDLSRHCLQENVKGETFRCCVHFTAVFVDTTARIPCTRYMMRTQHMLSIPYPCVSLLPLHYRGEVFISSRNTVDVAARSTLGTGDAHCIRPMPRRPTRIMKREKYVAPDMHLMVRCDRVNNYGQRTINTSPSKRRLRPCSM